MLKSKWNFRIAAVLALAGVLAVVTPQPGQAAGFALLEQSGEGLGVGYAGATAGYDDGSGLFYNPGAMGVAGKTQVSFSASGIFPSAKFTNEGSTTNPLVGGLPLSGDNGPDGGVGALLPALYIVSPTESGLTFGLGINSPFGLSTDYSRDWVGRYDAVKTKLTTVNIAPGVSYNITDQLAIGTTVNVTYVKAELTNAIDFGTIGLAKLGLPTAAALGLLPQAADGFGKVEGDDWGVGATVGLSWQYCPGSRMGLAYRSPVNVSLRGTADFEVPANARPLTATGAFVNTDAKADLKLPDSIAFGWIHEVSDQVSLLADVQWTHWNTFDELRVNYASTQPDTAVDESWKAVWRYSLGMQYRPIDALRLSAGFTVDQEPIPDKNHRTPRIPGNDRYWMAFGAGYNFTNNFRADLSYAHLFVKDSQTEVASSTGDILRGSWDTHIDVVSGQLTYNF